MRLLRTKNYTIGFIVALISLFSFSVSVKADEFFFNGITFNTDELDSLIVEEYNIDIENQYIYKLAFLNNNKLYYTLNEKINLKEVSTGNYLSVKSDSSYIKNDNYTRTLSFGSGGFLVGAGTSSRIYAYIYDFSNNTYTLESGGWSKDYFVGTYDSNSMTREEIINWHKERFLYSNTNITTQYYVNNEKLNFYLSYEEFNSPKLILSNEYICVADECYYSIDVKLTQQIESTLNYEYSFDNENWHTLSSFSSATNTFNLKHYFNIPIYFRIRELNTNEILYSTLYDEDFSNVDKNIIVNETAGVSDGNEYVSVSFDFSEFLKYKNSGAYELTTLFHDNEIELFEDIWSTTIYKQGFENASNFSMNIKIKIDNKVIEELNYSLNEENKEFDDLYEDILNDNLEEELNNGDYSTVGGMVDSINSFINAISGFVSSFFNLIMFFFNSLNIWIRSFIIAIFVVIVICKIIKAVRK